MTNSTTPPDKAKKQRKTHTPRAVGDRYGRLVLLDRIRENDVTKWRCQCDCGNTTVVYDGNLITGHTRSCGCLMKENQHDHGTHRLSGTRAYGIWCNMVSRCTNQNDQAWAYYGGRGITVCERWRSFENFYEDMEEAPEGMSIDRIDNDGNYEPGNCRWATQQEQMSNTRRSRYIEYGGKRQTVTAWARELGVSHQALFYRINAGMADELIITKPLRFRAANRRPQGGMR